MRPKQSSHRRRARGQHRAKARAPIEERFAEAMAVLEAPWPGAVGVSGGSDSLALIHLLHDWARRCRLAPPVALCVDHGVRPESGTEAQQVVRSLRGAGIRAHVLSQAEKPPGADVEAACRAMRYRLIGGWAAKRKLRAVYVAHTRDDQAETFLLRLARGSGVDGLAAMRKAAPYPDPAFHALTLVRPLLDFTREELRRYLEERGQAWIDDPMNADPRFARARIRQAAPQLESLGLTATRLAETAAHLARAKVALDLTGHAVIATAFRPVAGGVALDPAALSGAPRELGLRAFAWVLMRVGRRPYRPRFERLEALFDCVADGALGRGRTLHGCRIAPATRDSAVFGGNTLVILPEKPRLSAGKSGS